MNTESRRRSQLQHGLDRFAVLRRRSSHMRGWDVFFLLRNGNGLDGRQSAASKAVRRVSMEHRRPAMARTWHGRARSAASTSRSSACRAPRRAASAQGSIGRALSVASSKTGGAAVLMPRAPPHRAAVDSHPHRPPRSSLPSCVERAGVAAPRPVVVWRLLRRAGARLFRCTLRRRTVLPLSRVSRQCKDLDPQCANGVHCACLGGGRAPGRSARLSSAHSRETLWQSPRGAQP